MRLTFLILLVAHFYRYTALREDYPRNFTITTALVILTGLAASLEMLGLDLPWGVYLAWLILVIPVYFYFERPMYRENKAKREEAILKRSELYNK